MRAPLPDWMRDRFERVDGPDAAAIVRADFREAFEAHGLFGCAGPGDAAGAPLRAGGRGDARVLPAGALGEVVVRPFRRGGWVRHFVRDRYLGGNRAFREIVLTERLRRAGAPVPEALAAVQSRVGPGPVYAACLVTRRAAGFAPAAEVLRGLRPGEAAGHLERIGAAIRRTHEAGGAHADLNAWNVLVAVGRPGLSPILIDWDRGRWREGGVTPRRARANLARLRRSFRKLGLAAALGAWEALERGYASGPEPVPAA
ncbi:MAG: lipopolysaccharide kinase InaA family protein [Gemmatimonadota bacterium]|jgi:3-deoxy-D-manno-octulosonic acid kinase